MCIHRTDRMAKAHVEYCLGQDKHQPASPYCCPKCFETNLKLMGVEPDILNNRKVVVVKYECCNLLCQNSFAVVEPVSEQTARDWDKHFRMAQSKPLTACELIQSANEGWIGQIAGE